MTFFDHSLNHNLIRSAQAPASKPAVTKNESSVALPNLTSLSTADVVQFSPLVDKKTLQNARFADLSSEQVQARVAASLQAFEKSPVSRVLAEELPESLKNNARFAEILSEKAVDFI